MTPSFAPLLPFRRQPRAASSLLLLDRHATSLPAASSPALRPEGGLLIVLTILLMAATSPFFGGFTIAAVAAGLVVGAALRWEHSRHPTAGPQPRARRREPGMNIAAVDIGGDAGGLLFVVGIVAIVLVSLPAVRAFLLASSAAGAIAAAALVAWRRIQRAPGWVQLR